MAQIAPFAALRPTPDAGGPGRRRSLRRREQRRGAALADGEPAQLPARLAARDRPARPAPTLHATRSTPRRPSNFDRLRRAAPLVVEDGAESLRLPPAHGRARADRRRGLLLGGRVRRATSSRSTRRRGPTRKTTARATSWRCARRPARCSSPIARRRRSTRVVARVAAQPPLYDFTAADGVRHTVWRVPEAGDRGARRGVRGGAGALHRRRPPSRGQRRARAPGAAGARAPGEHERVPGRRLPRRPDADPAVPPRRAGPATAARRRRSAPRCAERFAVSRRRRRDAGAQGPGGDVPRRRRGTTHRPRRRAGRRWRPTPRSTSSGCRTACSRRCSASATSRTDKRIDFVGGIRGTGELERLVDGGAFAVAFSLYPGVGRRPDAHRRRRRHHAAEVHLVRAEAARRRAQPPDVIAAGARSSIEDVPMKVLVADKFEAERARRPAGRSAARSSTSPTSRTTRWPRRSRATGADGAGRALDEGHRRRCSTPGRWRWSSAPAPASTPSTSPAASARGIYVSNCPGKNAVAVAELAFGLILALDRRIPDNVAELRAGTLEQEGVLEGARAATAARSACSASATSARKWRVRARGVRHAGRRVEPALRAPIADRAARGLERRARHRPWSPTPEEVVRRADVLSVHLALAKDTRGFVERRRCCRTCRPGAFVINTARAEVVDQRGARRGDPREAACASALDVFADEPTAAHRRRSPTPIVQLPGVYGTHHIGASTDQAQEAIAAETVRIVRTFKETGPRAERRQPGAAHAGDAHAGRAAPRSSRRARPRVRRAARRRAQRAGNREHRLRRRARPPSPASTSTARRPRHRRRRARPTPTSSTSSSCPWHPLRRTDPRSSRAMTVTCNASSTSPPVPPSCPSRCCSKAQRDLVALPGVGMSVLEISHRSKTFEAHPGRDRGRPARRSAASRRTTRCCSCRAARRCSSRWCR